MKIFNCPTCQKDWPENYCPECSRTIERDDPLDDFCIDGDIINDSWAACAAKIRLNPLRYLWFKPETQLLLQIWIGLAVATTLALVLRWWIVGGILMLPFLLLSGLLWWISRRVAEIYQNALLTAGLVVSLKPLEFISLANMDAGSGNTAYAVKRVSINRLPGHPETVGCQFPCVSGFQDGPTSQRWGDFNPEPLSFGTGDLELIEARRKKLGEAAFIQLQKAFVQGRYPKESDKLVWLNEIDESRIPPIIPAA